MEIPTIQQALEVALQHHRGGDLPQAEAIYRQILTFEPRHADALHLLGMIGYHTGHYDDAEDLIQQAIRVNGSIAAFHNNLGEVHRARGRLSAAAAAYRKAIRLQPEIPEAHNNLGFTLAAQGKLAEAMDSYRKAIRLKPEYFEAHNNLGNALQAQGKLDQATAAYREALRLKPGYPEAHNNLGLTFHLQGKLEAARAEFLAALESAGNRAVVKNNLATVLTEMERLDDATAALQEAIQLEPDFPEAHNNLCTALLKEGRVDEAVAAGREALRIRPDFMTAHSNLVFTLRYQPGLTPVEIAEEHRQWNLRHGQPPGGKWPRHHHKREPDRQLRIGYVSPDFRDHVVGRNVLAFLRHHDHGKHEIFCYSNAPVHDAYTCEFQQLSDGWREIAGLSDEAVAALIRKDRIDILVDLALHTAGSRLLIFARKPAPVQVSFAGYPGSTGLEAIDYWLSDPYLESPDDGLSSLYPGRPVLLPHSFWCFDPLNYGDIPVGPLPATTKGQVTFGCLNSFRKVNPGVLELWAQVLRAVEDARVLLLVPEGSTRTRVWDSFERAGVAPSRVEFAPHVSRGEYLRLYDRIDIALDPFPYNGHTTSLESFWMGVPVITLVGQTTVSRGGWSQLCNLGLPELAGHTPEAFVRIAVELAGDLPRLAELRRTLRPRMEASPLMDAPGFTRGIEAAFREMWREWCAEPGQ